MTYVPNRIWIPTHGGDLGHYRLCMEERTMESPMEPPQPKRGGGRKRKNCRCDLCISRALYSSMVETMWHEWRPITPVWMTRPLHKSRQPDWRDSKGSGLEKTIWPGSFLENYFKRAKMGKNSSRGSH
jgi:hypothetical protein